MGDSRVVTAYRVTWNPRLPTNKNEFKTSFKSKKLANPVTELAEKAVKGHELSHGAS
jgi:hypothetical protein